MTADTTAAPPLPDLRGIPLAGLADLPPGLVRESLRNVIPDEAADPVPVAAFQSSI